MLPLEDRTASRLRNFRGAPHNGFDRIIAGHVLPDGRLVLLHHIGMKVESRPAPFDHVAQHHRLRLDFPDGLVERCEGFVYRRAQKRAASVAFAPYV
jgi:hypothetical protein